MVDLTYNQFVHFLGKLKEHDDKERRLEETLTEMFHDKPLFVFADDLKNLYLSLLEMIMEDDESIIRRWVYDTNYGENGVIVDLFTHDKFKLNSAEGIYDYLINQTYRAQEKSDDSELQYILTLEEETGCNG